MDHPRILISGAGIAGLAFAKSLDQFNIPYVLIEKHAQLNALSSGIALPFNAVQALRTLGVADQVLKLAHQVKHITYADKNGKTLSSASLCEQPLNRDKFIALPRLALHCVLAENLKQEIQFSTSIQSFEHQDGVVRLECNNEAINGDYDLVVSAEGLHSPLRKACYAGDETVVDFSVPNWRFCIERPGHGLEPLYMLSRSELFMAYPMSEDTLYCYAHVYDPGNEYQAYGGKQSLNRVLRNFGGIVPELLADVSDHDIISSRLQSVSRPFFFKDRIAFIGDAGNACSPLLQQGAASAFEDALCLASAINQRGPAEALKQYDVQRRGKVSWVVANSDGPLRSISKMQSAIGASVRNTLIRFKGPLNVQGWRKLATEEF